MTIGNGPESGKKIENADQNPRLAAVEDAAKKSDPEKVGKKLDGKINPLDEIKKDQQLGLAEKMPQSKVDNIINFVEKNDVLVSEYEVIGIADGHKFEEGPSAQAIRKQCSELIRDLGQRTVLPTEYQADYLNTINKKAPNEVLALTRALLLLSQLPQATLDKISGKMILDPHTETIKAGEFRTGGINAYTENGTFDITQPGTVQPILPKTIQLETNPNIDLKEMKKTFRMELKNFLPRIDFILQTSDSSGKPLYFQKQVNTDGTSKSGWNSITPTTYNLTKKHINTVDMGSQDTNKSTAFGNVRSDILGKGEKEAIVSELNKNEDKNKQVRIDAAKQYLSNIAENPDPRLAAFVTKVETSLGKGGFKKFVSEEFNLKM